MIWALIPERGGPQRCDRARASQPNLPADVFGWSRGPTQRGICCRWRLGPQRKKARRKRPGRFVAAFAVIRHECARASDRVGQAARQDVRRIKIAHRSRTQRRAARHRRICNARRIQIEAQPAIPAAPTRSHSPPPPPTHTHLPPLPGVGAGAGQVRAAPRRRPPSCPSSSPPPSSSPSRANCSISLSFARAQVLAH